MARPVRDDERERISKAAPSHTAQAHKTELAKIKKEATTSKKVNKSK